MCQSRQTMTRVCVSVYTHRDAGRPRVQICCRALLPLFPSLSPLRLSFSHFFHLTYSPLTGPLELSIFHRGMHKLYTQRCHANTHMLLCSKCDAYSACQRRHLCSHIHTLFFLFSTKIMCSDFNMIFCFLHL